MVDTNRVQKILDSHRERNSGVTIVKITTTRYYEIPKHSSTNKEALMNEWFEDFSPSSSHAFRDGSLLIEHFNDDAEIV